MGRNGGAILVTAPSIKGQMYKGCMDALTGFRTSTMTSSSETSSPNKDPIIVNDDNSADRKTSDFSIDHILNRAGCVMRPDNSLIFQSAFSASDSHFPIQQDTFSQSQRISHQFDYPSNGPLNYPGEGTEIPFTWLHCTRYCPPKIPRKRDGPQKRQLGRHPRIPFTSHQLSVLEERFKQSPYLSSEEVTRISRILNLADIRVKIWFQNRRARERREKMQNV